jgi:Secretion system C-terminal sorting domain
MKYYTGRAGEKIFLVSLLMVLFGVYSTAQQRDLNSPKLSHYLNYHPERKFNSYRFSQLPDTLHVYAIRVQFKPDNNPNTTGNGRFDLSNNYPDSVDAPPHDSAYFANHLEFLKNYYYKSSKGKLVIKYQLLGNVRNLSLEMQGYSPDREGSLDRMGRLFFDAWASADSVVDFSGIDISKSAFIIFHAGAGRDVDLLSQGIFQGQQDIPSIYLGLNSLKSIYGDTTRGYYTKDGIIIPGSCILPEQEYRVIESTISPFYLELGLNGIIVASIGSNLGLPDLFDTETGSTAIGRFGLMDGQSLFSYLGVFPPEPSAWEKQYLGWVNPVTVYSNGTYSSRAASLDDGTGSVFKVLISAKEYFLIENRNRDAHNNGETVYYVKNGVPSSRTFNKDVDGFQNGDIWKLSGNITDVDELDWSLPGLKNDTADFQGGLLVWHIDENVIDSKISTNTINNDINHRGVDLEEAKGAQEIGVKISTPFGVFIGDGTPFDYWYNGNHYVPSTIYKNEFTPYSIPNSKSYSNFNSRVCLRNFSAIDSVMTFTYEQCGSISNMNGFPRFVGIDISGNAQPIGIDYNGNGWDEIFVNVKDSLYGFRDNGSPIRVDMPNGFLKDSVAKFIVGYLNFPLNSPNKYVVGTYGNKLSLLSFTIDSMTTEPLVTTINSAYTLSTPALIVKSRLSFDTVFFAGTNNGRIAKFKFNNPGVINYDSLSNRPIVELATAINGTLPQTYSAIDNSYKYLASSSIIPYTFEPNSTNVRITSDNKIEIANNVITDNFGITNIYSSPTIADINKDGTEEIIFSADDKVFAVNKYGVVIDNFPFKANGVSKISSGIAVADIDGDGIYEVIFGTGDGRVYAYNTQGRILDGFPLLTGKEIKSTPALVNSGGKFGVVTYSTDGYLYWWKTGWNYDSTKILWRNFLMDKYHSNYGRGGINGSGLSGPCLPADKVYNWPNPVYGKSTNIRYFLNGTASSVKVRILDLSGELVTTLNGPANTGFDNEVVWDVSSVQSGIYIAVLELQEGSCSETPSIKIAVVK